MKQTQAVMGLKGVGWDGGELEEAPEVWKENFNQERFGLTGKCILSTTKKQKNSFKQAKEGTIKQDQEPKEKERQEGWMKVTCGKREPMS